MIFGIWGADKIEFLNVLDQITVSTPLSYSVDRIFDLQFFYQNTIYFNRYQFSRNNNRKIKQQNNNRQAKFNRLVY